jgi:hypothetical protein
MNFLKLCPNFVGSFDWKIFYLSKIVKVLLSFEYTLSQLRSKNVLYYPGTYDQIFPCICEKDPILLSWDYGVEKIIKTEKTYII